jgi:hypothetical protein
MPRHQINRSLLGFGLSVAFAASAQSQIVANAQFGTADVGIGSKAISNVVATDTVNGAPAVLGSGGNAIVNKYGTWPAGIALNPANGLVSTSASAPVGTYSFQYQLCDLFSDCARSRSSNR